MLKIICAITVLAIGVIGLGFYRGWFAMSANRPTLDSKVNVNLTVDPGQMKHDAESVKDKAQELTGQAKE